MNETIIILDFGSQYSQLITRKVREAQVYCELLPWDISPEIVLGHDPKGFILSGGPASVYAPDAPTLPDYIIESEVPVLGICYGMHLISQAFGGRVSPAAEREYGLALLERLHETPLLPHDKQQVWMSHGDRIEELPPNFIVLGKSNNCPIAAFNDYQTGRRKNPGSGRNRTSPFSSERWCRLQRCNGLGPSSHR